MVKLMAMVLTSSHSCYAERAVKSIIEQHPNDYFTYSIFVNVNSKNPGYYAEVFSLMQEKYPQVTVIQTESNGYPGRGHNSCFEIFRNHPEYDYLAMIDGDDLFFPVAFQQYAKLLVAKPETDIAHLMINDNITTRVKDHQNIKLNGNFYLYTAANAQTNWWQSLPIENPYVKPLIQCRTPSRIVLASRKVFDTDIPIIYSEDCKLYDDYLAFLSIVENESQGKLNTVALSDPTIYCYNAENDEGATLNFTSKFHNEEQLIFNKESKKYNALKENHDYIKKLPYYRIPESSEFTLKDRVSFCNEHFVMYEIRDRIAHAQEALTEGKIKKARDYYIRANNGGAQSNALNLNLGVCQYKTGLLDQAIDNFHKILLTEDRFEPHSHLAVIYYQQRQFKKACFHALSGLKLKNDSAQMQDIFNKARSQVLIIPTKPITKQKSIEKPIMCFYTGYSDPFNGKNYQERSVYGSEIAAVKIAEQMAEKYNVFVFCPCRPEEEIEHRGVTYMHLNKFTSFQSQVHINVMIVSRFIHFFYLFRVNADKMYLWVHDARSHDYYQGKQFGTLGKHFFNNIAPTLDGIVCVSDWHRGYFKKWSGISEKYHHKVHVIGNSVDLDYFDAEAVKKKNRFVYCSDPSRGLDILLKCWPQILKKHPDSTLDIYFSKLSPVQSVVAEGMPGVTFRGKIPEKKLCEELCKADVFFYPNTSHETYCIVAQQALTAKCVVICRRYSGLLTTVGTGGKLISGNPESQEWQDKAVNFINTVLSDPEQKKRIQNVAGNYGRRNTWDSRGQEWFKILGD